MDEAINMTFELDMKIQMTFDYTVHINMLVENTCYTHCGNLRKQITHLYS